MLKFSTTPYLALCAVHGGRSTIGTRFRENTKITTFNECEHFTRVTVIEGNAFFNASSLAEITFPAGLRSIDGYSLRGTKLTKLVVPAGVTSIGSQAFIISSLTTVVMLGTTPPSTNSNNFTSGRYYYVPDDAIDTYKAASVWSTYTSYIKPMSELLS